MTTPSIEAVAAKAHGEFSIGGLLWPGLSKLIEECGEVMQVAGKLIGSEGRTDHWSGDLGEMLIDELGDLAAAMEFFVITNNLDMTAIGERRERKLELLQKWHAKSDHLLSINRGTK